MGADRGQKSLRYPLVLVGSIWKARSLGSTCAGTGGHGRGRREIMRPEECAAVLVVERGVVEHPNGVKIASGNV